MSYQRRNTTKLAKAGTSPGGKFFADWITLTFGADNTHLGAVPLWALNWFFLLTTFLLLYFFPGVRLIVSVIIGIWLLATMIRTAIIMPARREKLQFIYNQTQKTAGLPRSTTTQPIDPKTRITIRKWGKQSQPLHVLLTIGDCPAATSVYAHGMVEKSIQAALGEPPLNETWIFTWPSRTQLEVYPAAVDSEKASQQKYQHKVRKTTMDLFHIKPRDAADNHFSCTGWVGERNKIGAVVQVPTEISLTLGHFDSSEPAVRNQIEHALDQRIRAPGEWIYTWDDGDLHMARVGAESIEAQQKRTIRKISSDVTGLVRTTSRTVDCLPVTHVSQWMSQKNLTRLLNTTDVPSNYPAQIIIDFGTRNLSDRKIRDRFEVDFDAAMHTLYAEVTWLYNWTSSSTETMLYAQAVALNSTRARRKAAERRLRNVVESKFGSSRNFVDCDVLEWQPNMTETGEALPHIATVDFGDFDVTKRETQDNFEQHWDSLTDACDWHYSWSPADGTVTMTAVPALPRTIVFPQPKTELFEFLITSAREGKIIFGPQKGGGWLTMDFNSVPHMLTGGATGHGKSVTMTVLLFLALYNVDLFELYVCDPKRTDFTWTPEFPNVKAFAATDTEIVTAIAAAKQEMDRRQALLNRVGVRNLRELRFKFDRNPELVTQHGPAPRRLILFFDELAEFLAKSANKETEELKASARDDLESIGRLGRAMEVNIVSAAQKPDAKIISTQLREQLGFRMCVGPVADIHTSKQILNSDHGVRFPREGTPEGRLWAWDSKHGYRMAQSFFIPDETGPLPWDKETNVTGAKDILRQHLRTLGYERTQITNTDGGTEDRWIITPQHEPPTHTTPHNTDETAASNLLHPDHQLTNNHADIMAMLEEDNEPL